MSKKEEIPVSEAEKGKESRLQVSRRDFLKGLGASTVAAAMITTPGLNTEAEAALAKGVRETTIQMEINGRTYRLMVKSNWTLLDVLRRELGLTGTKNSCDRGSCGACTVIMDGKAVYACALLAVEADKRKITTIEGLSEGEKLHPIQSAFIREDALQCGFCTPAMIMTTKALLDSNPRPSENDVKEALSGTICRCAAYPKIIKAVMSAGQKA
jgi:aerobic-type carbon monoxide dehydrogenase small subunit (CoxS/CutS family)